MQAQEATVVTCPDCGTRVTEAFSRELGRCMVCLLRVGFEEEEAADQAHSAPRAERFGPYKIERREDGGFWELGRGAMGVTYRAIDTSLQRPVALKLIDPEYIKRGAEARERFMREARAAASLRHPNVATVYHFAVHEENGQFFFAMELVEGETLEMHVRRTGPLDPLTTVEIALQVSSALAAAEKHGVVHRDLKPANLMLVASATDPDAPDARRTEVKVIDFGVAKALIEKPDAIGLTQGGFVGTPAFASPEQFTSAPVDVRSDIYSLGATLWYLLTGCMPFSGASMDDIRVSHQLHVLPVAQLKAVHVPSRLVSLLRSMLALEPGARPGVRALASKLQRCRAQILDRWKLARRLALAASLIGIVVATFTLSPWWHDRAQRQRPAPVPAKSIAVLPFENLSAEKENAFFADGVQDDVLTYLAKIAELKVISRTSVMQFKSGAERDLREIGATLGVAYVLEGSVRRSGGNVRVTAQLTDARTKVQLWAERYDREWADIFEIQSEIAQKIADQLRAKLTPKERAEIQVPLTKNVEAYDLYLRAKAVSRNAIDGRREIIEERTKLLGEAIRVDPTFVAALCHLARAHLAAYWFNHDRTAARLALAKDALDTAARLQPDDGDVHLARARWHYWGKRDYAAALAELELARRIRPNEPEVVYFTSLIERRQGQWEKSLRDIEAAILIDPRNINVSDNLATTQIALRQYAEAARTLEEIRVWRPDDMNARLTRAWVDVFSRADLRPLQDLLSEKSAQAADPNTIASARLHLALSQRDYRAAREVLSLTEQPEFRPELSDLAYVTPREWYEGIIARALGDTPAAKAAFLAARERAAPRVARQPDDGRAIMMLAEIDAQLGRHDDAIRGGEHAAKLLSIATDALDGPIIQRRLAGIYAQVNQIDRALDQLAMAANTPNGVHYGSLKLDEVWDPLRRETRFEKIVASLAPK